MGSQPAESSGAGSKWISKRFISEGSLFEECSGWGSKEGLGKGSERSLMGATCRMESRCRAGQTALIAAARQQSWMAVSCLSTILLLPSMSFWKDDFKTCRLEQHYKLLSLVVEAAISWSKSQSWCSFLAILQLVYMWMFVGPGPWAYTRHILPWPGRGIFRFQTGDSSVGRDIAATSWATLVCPKNTQSSCHMWLQGPG